MTTPAPKDISIKRGDSFDLFFRVKGRNGAGDLVYLDLTGCTPKAQIRDALDTLIIEIDASITEQVTLTGGVLLRLEDTDTSALEPTSQAVWDCEIKWPGATGDRKTVLAGTVEITKDITHA